MKNLVEPSKLPGFIAYLTSRGVLVSESCDEIRWDTPRGEAVIQIENEGTRAFGNIQVTADWLRFSKQ